MSKDTDEIFDVVEKIRPLLAGRKPHVQGAILADLAATWLAGHIVVGNDEATAKVREEMLMLHLEVIRKLVPHNALIEKTRGSA